MTPRIAPADVAVVVPTFNRLDLLEQTVDSLRGQTMVNAQFVIVDDRSETQTQEYLRSLPSSDPRFKVIVKGDDIARGCQASRNIGLDTCDAGAVVFLDSDDLLQPACLSDRFEFLNANPDVDIVVGRQAILGATNGVTTWVNVPKPGVSDIDRFLELTHPIDVPWVNGGAMFRTRSLKSKGVRWRPEFHWDDVAFHFECVAAGLRSAWMDRDDSPDSYYRAHTGQRYGSVLFTVEGISNSSQMIRWMRQELRTKELANPSRLASVERAMFKACVLPTIDAGRYTVAMDLVSDALAADALRPRTASRIDKYITGRRLLAKSQRATFYWNRFSDKYLLSALVDDRRSTYGTVTVAPAQQLVH